MLNPIGPTRRSALFQVAEPDHPSGQGLLEETGHQVRRKALLEEEEELQSRLPFSEG